MTRTSFVLAGAIALATALPTATAQSQLTEELVESAETIRIISIVYDVDRYVYDLYDGQEDEVVLYERGALVLRSESEARVMAVLEDATRFPATSGPNAAFLTPPLDTVAQFIPFIDEQPMPYQEARYHRLFVFECADDLGQEPGGALDPCRNWSAVPPMDRGEGLDVVIIPGPELGGTGGGGRAGTDDDG